MKVPDVGPADVREPPAIPSARSDSTGQPRRPVLYWVRTGTVHVRIDASTLRLSAGQGVWIPATGWTHRETVTEPGSVVFPLVSQAGPAAGGPSEPTPFEVPDGWQDWLIQLFILQVAPFSDRDYSAPTIADLLRRASAQPASPRTRRPVSSPALAPPAMPKARGARAVAEELIRDPALDLTSHQWAARTHSSPSTLLRDFLADTGLTFSQWRLRSRLSAAVDLLAAGYEVDQVAARVGFTSRNGFTRAFKQQFGPTPHGFSRMLTAHRASGDLAHRASPARQAEDLATMVREGWIAPDPPHPLPATRTTSHTNDVHVLTWAYRGSGYLDIGERRHRWRRGVATWIPAGVEHVTGLHQDSISLPVGDASTAQLRLAEPLQAQFSPAWDDYLMFCSISARSFLRPEGYDPSHVLDLFTEQFAAQQAMSVPMPTDPGARTAAMGYLRQLGTRDAARAVEATAEVRRAFRDQTGMTFARWRYAARMRVARGLLTGGAAPSAVARRVGYAHLPTFSTAFTRFHGLSPRAYREREAGRA